MDFTQNTSLYERYTGTMYNQNGKKSKLKHKLKSYFELRERERASVQVNFSKSSLNDEPANVLSVCRACKTFSSKNDICFSLPCFHIAADVDVNCTSRYTLCRKAHR